MKWKTVVEDYFTFTRPQRRSIIIVITAICFCLIVRFSYSYFFALKQVPADKAFLQEANRLAAPDTTNNHYAYQTNRYHRDEDEADYRAPITENTEHNFNLKGELFFFDPNTLSAEGWKKLGVREKTIHTIQNYLSKGGKFRKPEDIKRIYGLFPNQAEQLLPYVQIADNTSSQPVSTTSPPFTKNIGSDKKTSTPILIDINNADTAAFIALPGIGSKLASRIVSFREKLGGFYTVDQIGETYGLPDSTFQKIKGHLKLGNITLKKLNVNIVDAQTLKINPYIRWNVANAIVQYRQQHGKFNQLEDLKKIALIDEQLWLKVSPYLTIE